MAVKKGLEELSEYKLTRKEVADFLGITPNAVKCSLRSGNKRGLEFRFNGYQNLFKVPKSLKTDPVKARLKDPLQTPLKSRSNRTPGGTPKVLNRGATHRGEGNYTSDALRMHNEMKIMNSLQKKFKNERHREEFEKLNEVALDQAWKNAQKEEEKKFRKDMEKKEHLPPHDHICGLDTTPIKYGTRLNNIGLERVHQNELDKYDREDERKNGVKFVYRYDLNGQWRNTGLPDFSSQRTYEERRFKGYDIVDRPDVAYEVDEYTLRRTPDHLGDLQGPRFKSKIGEAIYQAKQKLKNKY